MSDNLITKHLVVSGKVQGVFFRKNAKQRANELNIYGWVKNTNDDKVEILAQGNEQNLKKFIDWCKQGPPKATVENIEVKESVLTQVLKEFSIVNED